MFYLIANKKSFVKNRNVNLLSPTSCLSSLCLSQDLSQPSLSQDLSQLCLSQDLAHILLQEITQEFATEISISAVQQEPIVCFSDVYNDDCGVVVQNCDTIIKKYKKYISELAVSKPL